MTQAKILVVEDEENLRRLFAQYLRREAYEVVEAESGEAAVGKISAQIFDLVITDLQMATLSGLDVLKAARDRDVQTQVLILTGFGSVSTAVNAMQQGAYEYLTKPMHLEALAAKVRNALERRRLLQTLTQQQQLLEVQRRSLERDLDLARHVQNSLMPAPLANDRIRIEVQYLPMAWLGGDFADIFAAQNGDVWMSIVDVTGHGIAAALLVNRICPEVRARVRSGCEPEQVLEHLNRFVFDTFGDIGLYLTMMCVKCDLNHSRLHWAGSAHPPALLWQKESDHLLTLPSQNIILGFERQTPRAFHSDAAPFHHGDRLFLFTDGLLEIEDESRTPLGLKEFSVLLHQALKKPVTSTAAEILERASRHGNGNLSDDMLLMTAQFI